MISVIIPVYNVEPYLHRCINSVLNQTYKDLEIILVDDGSPDGCPKICDEYAKTDPRIKVIHKENGGLSSARNAGLDAAKGEYVYFIDSDDAIHPKAIMILYYFMNENNADIVYADYIRVHSYPESFDTINMQNLEIEKFNGQEALKNFYVKYSKISLIISCNKLYKKTIFTGIRFELTNCEDEFILFDILNASGNIIHAKAVTYYYYWNPDSISAKMGSKKRVLITSEFMRKRYDMLKRLNYNQSALLSMDKALRADCCYYYNYRCKSEKKIALDKMKSDYKYYSSEKVIYKAMRYLMLLLPISRKAAKVLFIKIFPDVFIII